MKNVYGEAYASFGRHMSVINYRSGMMLKVQSCSRFDSRCIHLHISIRLKMHEWICAERHTSPHFQNISKSTYHSGERQVSRCSYIEWVGIRLRTTSSFSAVPYPIDAVHIQNFRTRVSLHTSTHSKAREISICRVSY